MAQLLRDFKGASYMGFNDVTSFGDDRLRLMARYQG